MADFISTATDAIYNALHGSENRAAAGAAETAYNREVQAAQTAMSFSASEAEKQRAYETQMSNTAYQRSAADLKAAGLNPWLAVQNSASTPSSASPSGVSASASSASTGSGDFKAILQALTSFAGTAVKAAVSAAVAA